MASLVPVLDPRWLTLGPLYSSIICVFSELTGPVPIASERLELAVSWHWATESPTEEEGGGSDVGLGNSHGER